MEHVQTASSVTTDWCIPPPHTGVPSGFRLLCAASHEPSWIALSLQLDALGCHDARLRWVSTSAEAMTVLRNEAFDCILICHEPSSDRDWDALNLLRAIRSSGCEDPILILTGRSDDDVSVLCCEEHAELLVSPALWDSRALVSSIQRGIRQVEMRRENHRLAVANHRRLVRERDEADHLLQQQRDIIRELEGLTGNIDPDPQISGSPHESLLTAQHALIGRDRPAVQVPEEIKTFYQELLRTYVIMGAGGLGSEIAQLADVLAKLNLSPRDTLSLHVERVEQLVRGLGNRSTRHVMARADLLVLELIMHLGECYQRCSA